MIISFIYNVNLRVCDQKLERQLIVNYKALAGLLYIWSPDRASINKGYLLSLEAVGQCLLPV